MIKFKQGWISNPKTGVTKDIVVKAMTPNNFKDSLIGGAMVLMGIAYLTVTAFQNGSKKFEEAERETLSDLDLYSTDEPNDES